MHGRSDKLRTQFYISVARAASTHARTRATHDTTDTRRTTLRDRSTIPTVGPARDHATSHTRTQTHPASGIDEGARPTPSRSAAADTATGTASKLLEGRKARQPMEPHRRTLSLLVLVRELLLALTEGGARDADMKWTRRRR